jgi:nitric oxide dioxygenase
MQTRQYSLSQPHDANSLRISIKREAGSKCPGLVSNLMHDTQNVGDVIRVSHPAGDFFIDLEPKGPVVFISGGVGLTPLNSMLASLVDRTDKPITWIHGARCPGARAFATSIEAIQKENFKMCFFDSSDPAPSHFRGRVDLSKLDREKVLHIGNDSAVYYVCGPISFMQGVSTGLEELGVSKEKIFMERFAPGGLSER